MTDDYRLIDGREMPAGSELVRIEREVLAAHVCALWRLGTAGRREYLEQVQRSQGQAWRDAVAGAFTDEWEARKQRADELRAQQERQR